MKKVLVVGANGLVGRHFCQQCFGKGKYEIFPMRRSDKLNEMPDEMDVVLFLAQSNDYQSKLFTYDLLDVNVVLVQAIAERYANQNACFIYFSSASVYCASEYALTASSLLQHESNNPYIASKLMAEQLLRCFEPQYTSLHIVRPFFIYGPGQNPRMLFSRLIAQLESGEVIKLGQKGGLRFNPIFVFDVVRAIEAMMESTALGIQTSNLCGKEVVTLEEVIQMMAGLLNCRPNVALQDGWPLKNILGETAWADQCQVPLSTGLAKMIEAVK